MRIRTTLAAAAAAVALLGGAVAAAPSALACTVNCTNGTVNVGSTIGTTGFPTSFTMSGNAGTTATATATAYSVESNTNWTLTFTDDASDLVNGNNAAAAWSIQPFSPGSTNYFPIFNSTTITHQGSLPGSKTFSLPSGNGVTSVQIDSGGITSGGQNFADVFSVAIPSTAAPGAYTATFAYVLAGA